MNDWSKIPDGLERMEKNIQSHLKSIRGVTKQGLIEGGMIILRQSAINTPVRYGNLKASSDLIVNQTAKPPPAWNPDPDESAEAFSKRQAQMNQAWDKFQAEANKEVADQVSVCVGYGAYYAIFVHELHKTMGKFLQKAIVSEMGKVLLRVKLRAEEAMR